MPDSPKPATASTFLCDCDEGMRLACAGEPFYKEHQGKRYCVLHYPGAEKGQEFQAALQQKLANQSFDFRGVWFPGELSLQNFQFTTETNFSQATFNAAVHFRAATFLGNTDFSSTMFRDAVDFRNVSFKDAVNFNDSSYLSEADFGGSRFGADTYFNTVSFRTNANFSACTFSADTYFTEASFQGDADFRSTSFSASADFNTAKFSGGADFEKATFGALVYFTASAFGAEVNFQAVTFSAAVDFRAAEFTTGANFSFATFTDTVGFPSDLPAGDQASFDFKFANIESPESFSFPPGVLRPHWFININLRKFDLTNLQWHSNPREEIKSLERQKAEMPEGSSPSRLLSDLYRRLALSAEENHHYQDASLFRYGSMDARRRPVRAGVEFMRSDPLHWIYWATSGYGERVLRAFFWLIGIWVIAAFLYTVVGFEQKAPRAATDVGSPTEVRYEIKPLRFRQALTYSVGVMTLQKPEPRPATNLGQTIVLLETVLGPVQAALMALAIRRKFMTV